MNKTKILQVLMQQNIQATMVQLKSVLSALGMNPNGTKFNESQVAQILEAFTAPEQQQQQCSYAPAELDSNEHEDVVGTSALAVMSGVDDEIIAILQSRKDFVEARSDTLVSIVEETPALVLARTAQKLEERQKQRQKQGMQNVSSMFAHLVPQKVALPPSFDPSLL